MGAIKKKRCEFCYEWFTPHACTKQKQKCCSKPDCRKKRKARTKRTWWNKNAGYNKSRKAKIKAWARNYPNYWQKYRKKHPDYVARDNRRRCSVYRKRKISAKQDQLAQISLEKLESIKKFEVVSSAKQDQLHSQVNGILDYLFWKEFSAKQNTLANYAPHKQQYEYASRNLGGDKAIESG